MHRMLIVDDEESICFSMSEYFKAQGYEVDSAQDRDEAEALLSKREYSVVIEDLRLGGIYNMEGLDIVEHIKERYPKTFVVVLTAFNSSEIEAEARKRGAHAFMSKPKPLSDVAQVVYGLVANFAA